jgi:hypothetical protein
VVIQKILLGLGFKETYSIIKQKLSLVDGECINAWYYYKPMMFCCSMSQRITCDIESIIWLESFLRNYPGVVVIVSHDKMFFG